MNTANSRLTISNAIAASKPPHKASRHSTSLFGTTIYSDVNAIVLNRIDTDEKNTPPRNGTLHHHAIGRGKQIRRQRERNADQQRPKRDDRPVHQNALA
jgi:hypothetical protein